MDGAVDGGMRRVPLSAGSVGAFEDGRLRHALVAAGRPFRAGDDVILDDGVRSIPARVAYVTSAETPCALSPEGLRPGHAILSLEPIGNPPDWASGAVG